MSIQGNNENLGVQTVPNQTAVTERPQEMTQVQQWKEEFIFMQRQAQLYSESSLVPESFRGNIANTYIAVEMAHRMGHGGPSALMIMQNLYIVYGKPGWSSTFIIACLNSCGRFESLRFDMTGAGDTRACVSWTTDRGLRLQTGLRTLADAKAANVPVYESPEVNVMMARKEGWWDKKGSKWPVMTDLMLRYRAATLFGRLYAPELLMGMRTEDEIIDIESSVVPAQVTTTFLTPPKTKPKLKTVEAAKEIPGTGDDEPPMDAAPTAPVPPPEPPAPTAANEEEEAKRNAALLAKRCVEAAITEEQFLQWGREGKHFGDDIGSIDELAIVAPNKLRVFVKKFSEIIKPSIKGQLV